MHRQVSQISDTSLAIWLIGRAVDIRRASNVSFAYSVFFPGDFDFVYVPADITKPKLTASYAQQRRQAAGTLWRTWRLQWRTAVRGLLLDPSDVPQRWDGRALPVCSKRDTIAVAMFDAADHILRFDIRILDWPRSLDLEERAMVGCQARHLAQHAGQARWRLQYMVGRVPAIDAPADCRGRVNGDLVLHSNDVMYRNAVAPPSTTAQDADAIDYLTSEAAAAVTQAADDLTDDGSTAYEPDAAADAEKGLVGQVADGLLDDISQIGGIIKRRLSPEFGPVQTKPRIGLVNLFREPKISLSALNYTLAPLSTAAEVVPSTAPANVTGSARRRIADPDQVWDTPANAAHRYFPALGSYAAKTNSRPTTFMGMMFGRHICPMHQ